MRKRPILALLTVLFVAVAVVWYQPWTNVPLLLSQVSGTKVTPSGQAINFSYVDLPMAPQTVQKLAQQNRQKEATALLLIDATPYIVATRGVKPTAGYGVEITGISLENVEGKPIINLKMKYTDPQPGQVTASVLTYPVVIARVDLFTVPQGLVIQVERN